MSELLAPDQPGSISRPPTAGELFYDRAFRALTFAFALLTLLAVLALVADVSWAGWPAMAAHGAEFLTTSKWGGGHYGILPEIWGTLYSAIVGVAIGTLFC